MHKPSWPVAHNQENTTPSIFPRHHDLMRKHICNEKHFPHFFPAGSGELEFEEFCILAARFLIEEDEEQMRRELKEAFRFYDKEGELPYFMYS